MGKQWLKGVLLNWETGDIDLNILETLHTRFNQIKDDIGKSRLFIFLPTLTTLVHYNYIVSIVSNMSVWVDTSGPAGFKIKAKVRYMWPRLTIQKSVLFPLTALGNETLMDVVIQNPSNHPVVFQAAMAQQYGASWTNFVPGNLGSGGNTTEGEMGKFNMGHEKVPSRQLHILSIFFNFTQYFSSKTSPGLLVI